MKSKIFQKGIMLSILSLALVGFFMLGGLLTNTATAVNPAAGEISVGGTGIVMAKPDVGIVVLGVETSNKDSKVAQEENTKLSNQLIAALTKENIKKDDIKTSSYNMYQERQYNPQDGRTTDGNFRVSHYVEVTVRDIDKVGAIIDLATKSGANQVNGVRFTVSDTSKYYQEALKLAVKDADSKAKTLADTLGVKVGKPSKVTENSYNAPIALRMEMSYDMAEKAMANTELSTGEMEIRADLQVVYNY
ncbi:SIMPL domain-containing protein [Alkaliphilus transvaalensis]|uniref:SIMPL domain-containing protein n=1 Tax=Alkaliphilus transvaalensis TaxID=114628 RepID=UPI0006851494|nr:SIMPL domain-containing protein [Alkaliphilus transvaalensis]